MDTKTFLESFHEDEQINFRVINTTTNFRHNLNGYYNENITKQLAEFNKQGYDIYFVVNGGGTKKSQINKINAVFIDFDCGKDEVHRYFPLEITERFKDEKLEVIRSFPLRPTFIVKTRNGLHVYWLVESGASVEDFVDCQLRLIQFFGSDKSINSPERIMRLPGYFWRKKGYDAYLCDEIDCENKRYSIQDIINLLPEYDDKQLLEKQKELSKSRKKTGRPAIKRDNNVELIKSLDVEGLKRKLNILRGEEKGE